MTAASGVSRADVNHARYRADQTAGHYESFFQRANHPSRPLAFWIRYTLFSPAQRPADALGELWAIYFDGESKRHVAAKQEVPIAQCTFNTSNFFVAIADARLQPGTLNGSISAAHRLTWDLSFRGDAAPVFLLPQRLYGARLPRAKSLVGVPMAVYRGALWVDGVRVEVNDWVGSQNHNWGSRHTDYYAWGQVAGFDNAPDSFLEVATAKLKIGPCWTPFMTPLVLCHRGEELALNDLRQTIRARAALRYFEWTFSSATDAVRVDGRIAAPADTFVGLRYYNPPGGTKQCLNSKIAACEVRVTRQGNAAAPEVLSTQHRAAFEILTDDTTHGVAIQA